MRTLWLAICAGLLVGAGCHTGPPSMNFTVRGTVTSKDDGAPLRGARVTVETCTTFDLFDCDLTTLASASANSTGHYELAWTDLVACFDGSRLGQYHLTVELLDFVVVEQSASVTCTEEPQEIHFVMQAFPVAPNRWPTG